MPSEPTGDVDSNRLLAAVAEGDRLAFARLFDYFAPRIAGYLIRIGSSPATAEELAQEAMLQVWRKADRFDPARGAASTWIFAIARNLRTDRWRHDWESEWTYDVDTEEATDESPSLDEQLSGVELRQRVHSALAALAPDHAQLVRLCYFTERPQADIARDLEVPLGTMKSRIRVALTHLRRLLETDRP